MAATGLAGWRPQGARPLSSGGWAPWRRRLVAVAGMALLLAGAAPAAAQPGQDREAEAAEAGEGEAGAGRTQGRRLHRYPLEAGVDIVGEAQTARASAEETLLDVAARYAVGYEQIRMANPEVDTWLPGVGTAVRIPSRYILPDAPREGVVINLAEMRLYHYPEDEAVVEVFPVSIGRRDWSTPPGETRITAKIEDPAWYPPASIREEAAERGESLPQRVPPGPDNPLGRYAMPLEISGYLIHGTNRPWGIGMRSTHGCIRLHPHDIAHLFDEVAVGTQVVIVDQPFKAGWGEDGLLYLQAFPTFGGETPPRRERLAMAVEAVSAALGDRDHRVDGSRLRAAVGRQDGRIRRISRPGAAPVEAARRAE